MKYRYRFQGGYGDNIMATTNDTENWYGRNTPERQFYNPDFKVRPGIVQVRHREWAEPYAGRIMIEPSIKGKFSGENKRWYYWQELVDRCEMPLLQCGPEGTEFLSGIEKVLTPTFDHAVSVLSVSLGIVTTEGGLHHAAAALGKPAVVIFGAFNRPSMLGYDFHINLAEPDDDCLGQRKTHRSCIAAMKRISVERVLEAMGKLWN